jgi:hypothetical protein
MWSADLNPSGHKKRSARSHEVRDLQINKLGIPQSARDLWFCTHKERKVAAPVEYSLTSAIAA